MTYENKIMSYMITAGISMVLVTAVVLIAVSCKSNDKDDAAETVPTSTSINVISYDSGISAPETTPSNNESSTETTPGESIDLASEASGTAIPHLLQSDARWSEHSYAGSTIGEAGCGPTCLAMAAL